MDRTKICPVCQQSFTANPKNINQKFCGKPCYSEHQKTVTGEKNWNFGKKRNKEFCERMSLRMKGKGRSGKDSPGWKGGRLLEKSGYVIVVFSSLTDEEKLLFPSLKHNYVLEHRLVVAKRLGRPLKVREHVHHVNGVKSDNSSENLILLDSSKHMRGHMVMWKRVHNLEVEIRRLRKKLEKYEQQIPMDILQHES